MESTYNPLKTRINGQIKVLVIDDEPAVLTGLESWFGIRNDILIVAASLSVQDGLEYARRSKVDVVVLDFIHFDPLGEEAIRLFVDEKPEGAVLVYSRRADETHVFRALKAGARGYIGKKMPLEELEKGIRDVYCGGYALSPELNPAIIEFYLENRGEEFDELADYNSLTEREKQVFRLLADGLETRDIAKMLYISPKTVAKHRVAIKKKLSLDNPVEMAQYAMKVGILHVDA